MKRILIALFAILVVAGGAVLLLRHCSGPSVVVRADTVTLVRVDTVVIEKPVPVRVVEKEPVYIQMAIPKDTIFEPGDTVFVPVPILQYQFRDSLCALDVSGYGVSIDRLEVYPRTIYQTISKPPNGWSKTKGGGGFFIQKGRKILRVILILLSLGCDNQTPLQQ